MIKRANRRFLRQNSSTDVLAFGMNQGKTKYLIADIMISTDTALQNAKLFKTLPLYEVVTKEFKSPDGKVKTVKVELFTWEKLDYVGKVKKAFGLK